MTTENDIQRIINARVDNGLFVLAMHSLMERELKEFYGSKSDFGVLINNYTDYYWKECSKRGYKDALTGKTILQKKDYDCNKLLQQLYVNHWLSNDVRHEFYQLTDEDAQTSVVLFLAFADSRGWSHLQTLSRLRNEVKNWVIHGDFQSDEFKEAVNKIKELTEKNKNLVQQANVYQELKKQNEVLLANEKLLQTKLNEAETKLLKNSDKLKEARQENYNQAQELRKQKKEVEAQLAQFADTQKYLEYLTQISFYTKTRHQYEKSIISLSDEQEKVVNQIKLNCDYLVKGSAGTGKSFVLLKTLEKAVKDLDSQLFESEIKKFRLLTYTKSLVKYNQYVSRLLEADVPERTIITADSFLFELMQKLFPGKSFAYDVDPVREQFENGDFDEKAIYIEGNEFIWANNVSKEQYLVEMCERDGMKAPLTAAKRKKMWKAIEEVENTLLENDVWPRNFAAKMLCQKLDSLSEEEKKEILCEYTFVDEAQDLPPVVLSVIKKCTNRAVFLAGDSDQSIYRRGFSWVKSGIDISGHTSILHLNFRNTQQIHEYAEGYRSKFKKKDEKNEPKAYRPGPPVEHTKAKSTEELYCAMIEKVNLLLKALNYEEENICIIANTSKKLTEFQKRLEKIGVESQLVMANNFNFAQSKGIRLCTMASCKGLDFPVVLLLADHRDWKTQDNTPYDEETYEMQQRNLVYVALTRAMEMLHVYTVEGTEFGAFRELE